MEAISGGAGGGQRARRSAQASLEAAPWIRIAALASVGAVAFGAAGFLALGLDTGPGASPSPPSVTTEAPRPASGGPGAESAELAEPAASGPTAAATPTTGPATTTEPDADTRVATTTTVPSTDPLEHCTDAQRRIIERGNHPWPWYVDRFDADGDGILCE